MRLLAVFGLLGFVLSWQKLIFAPLFLLAPFYALYKENFLILWARKNIIKKATLKKSALFYRLTEKNTLLQAIAFCLALVAISSLVLNLMYANALDFIFLFVFFPLLFLFVKMLLRSQFRTNPYNTLRVVLVAAFVTSLFYSFSQLFFRQNYEPFFYLNNFLDTYKSSVLPPLDAFSQTLYFVVVFKNFMIFWLENLSAKCLIFGLEVLNFFVLCSSFALLCSFVLKDKKSTIFWLLASILSLLFYEESVNVKPKYQEKFSTYLQNAQSPLLEQNLSAVQEQNELYKANLAKFKELLNKNAFEISIWWLSNEKDELKKSLQKALP